MRAAKHRFGNQPPIAHWNLAQLGQAILPLIEEVKPLQEIINKYRPAYERQWQQMLTQKLGLDTYDAELAAELHEILPLVETDITIFYRQLAEVEVGAGVSATDAELMTPLLNAYYVPEQLTEDYKTRLAAWLRRYSEQAKVGRKAAMNAVNPKYVLRNYMAQLAIDKAEVGDFALVNELLELLRHPYD